MGGGLLGSSEHLSEAINVSLAGADVWVVLVKEVLEKNLLLESVESPPGGGDEVPNGVSTGYDGASEGVESLDHVLGHLASHHGETNVDGSGSGSDGVSNEFLETGIGVWDGKSFALFSDS